MPSVNRELLAMRTVTEEDEDSMSRISNVKPSSVISEKSEYTSTGPYKSILPKHTSKESEVTDYMMPKPSSIGKHNSAETTEKILKLNISRLDHAKTDKFESGSELSSSKQVSNSHFAQQSTNGKLSYINQQTTLLRENEFIT